MKIDNIKYYFLLVVFQVTVFSGFSITAKFTYNKSSNCAPSIVQFTNNSSSGNGIVYTWNFGLGALIAAPDNSSKEQLYVVPGKYKVTLIVSDGTNTDSTSQILTIARGPSASLVASPEAGCAPLKVNFTSSSKPGDSAILSTSWDLRNGNYGLGNSIQFTYNYTGKYDIILKVTDRNGCSAFIENDSLINVVNKPIANFRARDSFACSPPLVTSFNNLSTGATVLTYNWDYGNGQTSTELNGPVVYASNGSFDVKLIVTDQYGCSSSLDKKSYVNIGNSTGTISVFDPDGNLHDNSGLCQGVYKFAFSKNDLPNYTWTISDTYKTTIIKGKSIVSYQVSDSGSMNINLVYGNDLQCTASISRSFTKSYINANFSLDTSAFCSLPRNIVLKDLSKNTATASWFFQGNFITNNSDTLFTITKGLIPAVSYEQEYSHQQKMIRLPFKLKVVNIYGCSGTITKYVKLALPNARFTPDIVTGCVPLHVTFTDSSKSINKIDKYVYLIDKDSISSSLKIPLNYNFINPGDYSVREIIRSGSCIDTSEAIQIKAGTKQKPSLAVSPAEVCNGGKIHLSGISPNNSILGSWTLASDGIFKHNFISVPDTIMPVYSGSSGSNDIHVIVNYNGCFSDTIIKAAFAIKGPAGSFLGSFSCDSPLVYKFKAKISPATSLIWNINSAVYTNLDSIIYKFPQPGDYTVNLTADDNASNCSLTWTKLLKVRKVKADFNLNDTILCAGDTAILNASQSKDYLSTCYNEGFLWDFGDNTAPRRSFNPIYKHPYLNRGKIKITLVVSSENGCQDTTSRTINVFKPEGKFAADKTSGCVPELLVKFTNVSSDSTIKYWIWDYGDGYTSDTNSLIVFHNYSSAIQKTYTASFTAYDEHLCHSSNSLSIILENVNANFQADDNAICLGQKITFTPQDKSLDSLVWNFGDGFTSSSSNQHIYNSKGQYDVSLTATKGGCKNTILKSKYISVENADAGFLMSDSLLNCYPDTLTFIHPNLNGSPQVNLLWKFDSHTLYGIGLDTIHFIFTKPGIHTASLEIQTLNNCNASSSRTIIINGPIAYARLSPQMICNNGTVNFQIDSMINVTDWRWIFADGNTSSENPVSHRYSYRGELVPAILLSNSICTVTIPLDTIWASVVKADFTSIGNSQNICFGNNFNLQNQSVNSNFWMWEINDVPKSTEFNLSNLAFPNIGEYSIKLISKDKSNCSDTLEKIYTVVSNPAIKISGDSILCVGKNSIVLTATGDTGTKINWIPATGLNDPSSFITAANPAKTTTYTAIVNNVFGCITTRAKTIFVYNPADVTRQPAGDTSITIGERIPLLIESGSDDTRYIWSPDYRISCLQCKDPLVAPEKDVTYKVEVKNICYDIVENFNIRVIIDFYLEAPTAFSPNGDSNNDIFKFESQNIKSFDLKIFNRWGEIVFSTSDVTAGWDGKVNGHPQNIDTYTFYVKAESMHGYKFEKKGSFLLLK